MVLVSRYSASASEDSGRRPAGFTPSDPGRRQGQTWKGTVQQ